MAILLHNGTKVTATQAAKYMVSYAANKTTSDWSPYLDAHKLTRKETEKVGQALKKQLDRVNKMLGHPR